MPLLEKLTCLECNHVGLEAQQPDGHPACPHCAAVFDASQVVCPNCEHLNAANLPLCLNCRMPLQRTCPHCGGSNWSGAEQCRHCERPLDVLDSVIERQAHGHRGVLDERRSSAGRIKADQELSSRQRLNTLQEQEQSYWRQVSEARARRDAERRAIVVMLLIAAAGFIAFLIVGLVIVAFIQ